MTLEALFQSGNVTFLILGVMLIELVVLRRYLRSIPAIGFGMGAGACLLLALRSALIDQAWFFTAAWLAGSFFFHMLEVRSCLRDSAKR